MPGLVATTLDQIVPVIQQQLATALEWGVERVLIVDPQVLTYHPQGDGYLVLWPDLESIDRQVWEGAGRLDCRMAERLQIHVRTRYGVDEATSAAAWLCDQGLGHLRQRHQVWDTLIDFLPLDQGGNQLVLAPLEPTTGGRPRLSADEKEWGESVLTVIVKYQLALSAPKYQ